MTVASFVPQTEHLPSAVIFGCSFISAPQSPHFGIESPPHKAPVNNLVTFLQIKAMLLAHMIFYALGMRTTRSARAHFPLMKKNQLFWLTSRRKKPLTSPTPSVGVKFCFERKEINSQEKRRSSWNFSIHMRMLNVQKPTLN